MLVCIPYYSHFDKKNKYNTSINIQTKKVNTEEGIIETNKKKEKIIKPLVNKYATKNPVFKTNQLKKELFISSFPYTTFE